MTILRDSLFKVISDQSRFSIREVRDCYGRVGSYDSLLIAIGLADRLNISLVELSIMIREEKGCNELSGDFPIYEGRIG